MSQIEISVLGTPKVRIEEPMTPKVEFKEQAR